MVHTVFINWGAWLGWSFTLYCPMQNAAQMTIEKTHPCLPYWFIGNPFLKPFFDRLNYFFLLFSNRFSIFEPYPSSLMNSCDVGHNKSRAGVEQQNTNCLSMKFNNSFQESTAWWRKIKFKNFSWFQFLFWFQTI